VTQIQLEKQPIKVVVLVVVVVVVVVVVAAVVGTAAAAAVNIQTLSFGHFMSIARPTHKIVTSEWQTIHINTNTQHPYTV